MSEQLRDPSAPRFPKWEPPTCPVLPQFPGRLEASRQLGWMLRAQYPDCIRLQGGGFCPTCMSDVVAVHIPEGPVSAPERPGPVPQQRQSDYEAPKWRPN